jgi:hypothetical protein
MNIAAAGVCHSVHHCSMSMQKVTDTNDNMNGNHVEDSNGTVGFVCPYCTTQCICGMTMGIQWKRIQERIIQMSDKIQSHKLEESNQAGTTTHHKILCGIYTYC